MAWPALCCRPVVCSWLNYIDHSATLRTSLQHDISATLVHGVYEGHPVLYIYQLTSALANDGLFVIIVVIDLSSQSFVVLELAAGIVSNILDHLLTCICTSRAAPQYQHQHIGVDIRGPGTALHCFRELDLHFHGWLQ